MHSNERPLKLSGEPIGSPQRSEFDLLNKNGQPIIDSGTHSSDDRSQSKRLERQ
uniref:Uncharacterized protein n=1 Tax=Arundo donax TaxID=35708 RepID=A0A0A8YBP0_ARUDO